MPTEGRCWLAEMITDKQYTDLMEVLNVKSERESSNESAGEDGGADLAPQCAAYSEGEDLGACNGPMPNTEPSFLEGVPSSTTMHEFLHRFALPKDVLASLTLLLSALPYSGETFDAKRKQFERRSPNVRDYNRKWYSWVTDTKTMSNYSFSKKLRERCALGFDHNCEIPDFTDSATLTNFRVELAKDFSPGCTPKVFNRRLVDTALSDYLQWQGVALLAIIGLFKCGSTCSNYMSFPFRCPSCDKRLPKRSSLPPTVSHTNRTSPGFVTAPSHCAGAEKAEKVNRQEECVSRDKTMNSDYDDGGYPEDDDGTDSLRIPVMNAASTAEVGETIRPSKEECDIRCGVTMAARDEGSVPEHSVRARRPAAKVSLALEADCNRRTSTKKHRRLSGGLSDSTVANNSASVTSPPNDDVEALRRFLLYVLGNDDRKSRVLLATELCRLAPRSALSIDELVEFAKKTESGLCGGYPCFVEVCLNFCSQTPQTSHMPARDSIVVDPAPKECSNDVGETNSVEHDKG